MQHKPLVFLDGGTLVNILASGCSTLICGDAPFRFAVPSGIYDGSLILWTPPDESGEQQSLSHQTKSVPEMVTIHELLSAGMVEVFTADDCMELFVSLAMYLSDIQAKTVALAIMHNAHLATDDRRVRRVMHELNINVQIHSTPELIQEWHHESRRSDLLVTSCIQAISVRAQFCPLDDDPLAEWWHQRTQK